MNANLCSAAIWPGMAKSAALTTGSEAESISAHFLDHLVPHPKRGKYGLYHSPTLSFLSLRGWLRAVSTRTGRLGPVCTRACLLRSGLGGQPPANHPTPHPTAPPPLILPQIFALIGWEQLGRGARDPAPRPQSRGGRSCRSISGRREGDWSAPLSPALHPSPLQGSRGTKYPGWGC